MYTEGNRDDERFLEILFKKKNLCADLELK